MANVDHVCTYISHLQRDQVIGYKNINSAYINNLIAVLCYLPNYCHPNGFTIDCIDSVTGCGVCTISI